jgi:hypothetical protein
MSGKPSKIYGRVEALAIAVEIALTSEKAGLPFLGPYLIFWFNSSNRFQTAIIGNIYLKAFIYLLCLYIFEEENNPPQSAFLIHRVQSSRYSFFQSLIDFL